MPDGVGEVQDFMPPRTGEAAHRHRMIRRVLAVRGQMRFVVDFAPRGRFCQSARLWRRERDRVSRGSLLAVVSAGGSYWLPGPRWAPASP
jgi:hypothetical protein